MTDNGSSLCDDGINKSWQVLHPSCILKVILPLLRYDCLVGFVFCGKKLELYGIQLTVPAIKRLRLNMPWSNCWKKWMKSSKFCHLSSITCSYPRISNVADVSTPHVRIKVVSTTVKRSLDRRMRCATLLEEMFH